MKKILFILLILISACNAMDGTMKSWVGSSIDEVSQAWGPPDERHQHPDGSHTFLWNEEKFTRNGTIKNVCNKEFVTDPKGKIISYSYVGCKKYAPK